MRMTVWRWAGALALICAVAAVVLLPFPPVSSSSWMATQPPQMVAHTARLVATSGRLHEAVRRYRTAEGLSRWAAARTVGDTARVRIDASVPPDLVAGVRQVGAEAWSRLGAGASPARAQIFVYFDTSSITRPGERAANRRPLEGRLPFDLAQALPEATDGRRCVALVRLRSASPDAITRLLRAAPLLGPCGFFATFGAPGDGIRAWLGSVGYAVARRSNWDVPRAPAMDASAVYGLPETAGWCLTGDRTGCLAGLGLGAVHTPSAVRAPRSASSGDAEARGGVIDPGLAHPGGALGEEEGRLLADLVRDLGPERFARFWTSPAAPDSALIEASGEELSAWVGRWVARTYGAEMRQRPMVSMRDALWLAVTLPLLVIGAARRRERVLSERLFALGRGG